MNNIGYRRVSTTDQHTHRQLVDLGVELDYEFEDRCSAASLNRPQLDALTKFVRKGDVIHVHSIDRLARSVQHLLQLVDNFQGKGVSIHFVKEGLRFSGEPSSTDRLILSLLGSVAEFERSLIRERQREGIEQAKMRGVYRGRPALDKKPIMALLSQQVAPKEIARRLGCSLRTVQRCAKEVAE